MIMGVFYKKFYFILIVLIPSLICQCSSAGTSSFSYEQVNISFQSSGVSYTVAAEVADTPEKMSYGLMNRQSLGENNGMLFVYDEEQSVSFWMKDTYVSLDIIFMNSQKEIIYIEKNTTPLSTASITPDDPVMYVLEVNAGYSDEKGLSVGDILSFEL